MAIQHPLLFKPLNIGTMTIPGRIVKTATTETMSTEDGFVTDALVEFYEPFAKAGTPLIITGNLYTQRSGRVYNRMPGADHDDKLVGMARLVNSVHRHGSKICAQLSHAGRQVFQPTTSTDPVSASAVQDKFSGITPRALQLDEIHEIVLGFAQAALRCRRAGFDAIQIHAAQGYLLSQFLTPYTNRRNDAYGGSFENRLRIVVEILHETRALVGPNFPILVKLNGYDALPLRKGLTTRELLTIAKRLEAEGVDAIEISAGHYESGFPAVRGTFDLFFKALLEEGVGREYPAGKQRMLRLTRKFLTTLANRIWPYVQGFNLPYAVQFKAALNIPVICVGGFQHAKAMNAAVETGQCDAVSIARAMIADPYLVRHVRSGETGPACQFCSTCLAHIGSRALTCDHPAIARQRARMLVQEGGQNDAHAA